MEQNFIPPHLLKTAVLFLVFNRLDVTKQVFQAIRQARPPRLYVAADGARGSREGEDKKVKAVRDYIMSNIDWDCEVKTLFREQNLGCKCAVSSAINWFFENEEAGIILEDDCLPSQSFFWFCEELLEKYKTDKRIWHIGGYKYPDLHGDNFSYNFSRFTHVWGWASWADRWKHYDVELSAYKNNKNLLIDYEFFRADYENDLRKKILDKVISGEINTWDYQWNFAVRSNNGLSVRPLVNLIENVGFGEGATHTIGNDTDIQLNRAVNITLPLTHPENIMVYKADDERFGKQNLDHRFFSKIKRKLFGKI